MNEPMGIATELAAKREAMVARLSPGARARNFPKQYATPVPVENREHKLREQVMKLLGQLDDAKAEIGRLSAENKDLRDTIKRMTEAGYQPMAARTPTVNNVIRQFVYEYNALASVDNRTCLDLPDLFSPRRNRFVSWARQVCMSLCRDLCKGASLPMIGRAFGGKDHTTVMHACRVTPERLALRPDLALVAYRVKAHFMPEMLKVAA